MSGVEGLKEALEFIAEGHDVGRHDGLPEDGPAHDADTMFAVARAALSAIEGGGGALQPSASVPTEQADGGVLDCATWLPLDDNGLAEVRLNGRRITSMPSYAGAEEVAERINAALILTADFRATPPATPIAGGFGSNRQGDLPTERPETAVLVSLAECPPGLFWFGDTLGFKTEYGHSTGKDVGGGKVEWIITRYAEAYCVETGEYFWGGAPDLLAREELMVAPVSLGILRQQNEPKAAARRDGEAGQ